MTGTACESVAAVVEAVGCGDSLVGGFCAATVVGMPINESRQAAPRMAIRARRLGARGRRDAQAASTALQKAEPRVVGNREHSDNHPWVWGKAVELLGGSEEKV